MASLTSGFRRGRRIPSLLDVDSQGSGNITLVDGEDKGSKSENSALFQITSSILEKSPAVKEQLCNDYFLDFVTPSTPMEGCSHPLAVVANAAVAKLGLKACLHEDADRCLVRFAVQVEEGYPANLYHSKAHVVDVTNRLVALLVKTGISQSTCKDNNMLMLASIVAAMIHDYKHPQVTNNFLTQQVCHISP